MSMVQIALIKHGFLVIGTYGIQIHFTLAQKLDILRIMIRRNYNMNQNMNYEINTKVIFWYKHKNIKTHATGIIKEYIRNLYGTYYIVESGDERISIADSQI